MYRHLPCTGHRHVCMSVKVREIIYSNDISSVLSFITCHVIVEAQISRFFILFSKISAQLESFSVWFPEEMRLSW